MLHVWVFSVIFAVYILVYYGYSLMSSQPEAWNSLLGALYRQGEWIPNIGIALHFLSGAIILVIGPFQLFGSLRKKYPDLHKITGKVYTLCAIMLGVGGLLYILIRGTSGGLWMNIGFGLSGVLTIWFAIMTAYYGIKRQPKLHRPWALRLFCVCIGPFLYRIEYALWAVINGGVLVGHNQTWDGWFDLVMNFGYYVPNLILCELYIRKNALITNIKNNQQPGYKAFRRALIAMLWVGGIVTAWKWWYRQLEQLF